MRQLLPKVLQLDCKSTEAARSGRKKFSEKLWKKYFQLYCFSEKIFGYIFCLPRCSLSCGSCSQRCSHSLKIHWMLPGEGGKSFPKNCEKKIFSYIVFGENFLINFCLPRCSESCGSYSQKCSHSPKIPVKLPGVGGLQSVCEKLWKKYLSSILFSKKIF